MKRFKGFFLFLVIMLLSLGIASTTYARERNGSSREDRDWANYGSRGYRGRSDYDNGWGGPKLNYDGQTSGIGRELGGIVGDVAGAAIGNNFGGPAGGYLGGKFGGKLGERAGDAWERRVNRGATNKWNRNGSRGHSWRL